MNKKLIWGIVIVVVAIAIGVYCYAVKNQTYLIAPVIDKKEFQPVEPTVNSEWKTYTNEKYAFKLNYPSLFSKVIENQEDDTFLKSENCEISLGEDFGHGLPEGSRIDDKKVKIDNKIFEQRTIYGVNNALVSIRIYEILPGQTLKLNEYSNGATVSKCEPVFTKILSTFKFTNQVK